MRVSDRISVEQVPICFELDSIEVFIFTIRLKTPFSKCLSMTFYKPADPSYPEMSGWSSDEDWKLKHWESDNTTELRYDHLIIRN